MSVVSCGAFAPRDASHHGPNLSTAAPASRCEARGYWDVVAGSIVPPVIEGEADYLAKALELLPAEPWDGEVWPAWTGALKEATGKKGRELYAPLRLALTGEDHGPEMKALLPLIGRGRAVERLRVAGS